MARAWPRADALLLAVLAVGLVAAPALGITEAEADRGGRASGGPAESGSLADTEALIGGEMFRVDPLAAVVRRSQGRAGSADAKWVQQLRAWVRLRVASEQGSQDPSRQAVIDEVVLKVSDSYGGLPLPGADRALGAVPDLFALQFDSRTGELSGFAQLTGRRARPGSIDQALSQTRTAAGQAQRPSSEAASLLEATNLQARPSGNSDGDTTGQTADAAWGDSFFARTYRLGMNRSTQFVAVVLLLAGYAGLMWWVRHRMNRKDRPAPRPRSRRRRAA